MTVAIILIVPGPSVMYIVSRALVAGRPAAMAAAAGNTLGSAIQGLLAAIGLGSVIASSDLLYNVIKWGGAAYLVKMGAQTLRNRKFPTLSEGTAPTGHRKDAKQGFVVGLTNPKVIVFFAAILPQFVDPSRGNVRVQMLVLLAVYCTMSLVSDTSWGVAGGSIRAWSAKSPRRIEALIGSGGLCIVGVGLALALAGGN